MSTLYDESKLKQDVLWVVQAFNYENDFTCCMTSVSYLEAALNDLFTSKLRKGNTTKNLISHKGYLGQAAAKAQLAYSLNWINKSDYQNILSLLEIRNYFAHSHIIKSFEEKEVVELCLKLDVSELDPKPAINTSNSHLEIPKVRFSMVCVSVCYKLIYRE